MAGDDPDCQNVSFVRNYWSDNHSHCSLRSVPGRRRGVWKRNHGLHSCVRRPRLPSRQNVVSPRFCVRQNTSGHSKSLRAGARYGLKMSMKIKNNPCKKENFPLIFFWIKFFNVSKVFFFSRNGPLAERKDSLRENFFQDWGEEEDRKLSWTTEKLFSRKVLL